MTTIRVRRRTRHTTIDRRPLNDERLSFRARGVLVWLLDKPDDWRIDSAAISRHGQEGREAIRTALRELEALGYLVRSKVQGERGRWVTIVEVREVPDEQPTDAQEPVSGGSPPTPRNPAPGEPDVGAPGALPLEGLRPITETTPPGADAPEAAPRGGKCNRGRAVATQLWERRKARGAPVPAQPFIAVARIAESLIKAGHDPDAVVAAMDDAPTVSTRSIEFALSRQAPLRAEAGPGAVIGRSGEERSEVLTREDLFG